MKLGSVLKRKSKELEKAYKVTYKSVKMIEEINELPAIQNYYGAHKKYKAQFKNKRYRHVYQTLIHRKPAHEQYIPLFFQDLLISIIKSIEGAVVSKENMYQSIECFYNFGKSAVKNFYQLFLKEVRLVKEAYEINDKMAHKITLFLTLLVDFASKISLFQKTRRDLKSSQRIYEQCYKNIVSPIINSSTSNIRLLSKTVQFLIGYATFQFHMQKYSESIFLLKEAMKVELNELILIGVNFRKKVEERKRYVKKYSKGMKMLIRIFVNLAMCMQRTSNFYDCKKLIQDASTIGQVIKLINKRYKNNVRLLLNIYQNQISTKFELKRIIEEYFNKKQVKRIIVPQSKIQKAVINTQFLIYDQDKKKKVQFDSTNDKQASTKNFQNSVSNRSFQKNNKLLRSSQLNHLNFRKSQNSAKDQQKVQPLNQDMKVLLYGENFWKPKPQKPRSKSSQSSQVVNNSLLKSLQDEQVKKIKKRYSLKKHIVEVKNVKKGGSLSKFYKFQNTDFQLKKKRKNDMYLFKKKEKNPDTIEKVQQNIQKWHKQQQSYQKELFQKIFKLKQKSNSLKCKDYSGTDGTSYEENEPQKVFSQSKMEKSMIVKHQSKERGINLFKQIILKNKKQLNINIPEIYHKKNSTREKTVNTEITFPTEDDIIKEKAYHEAQRSVNQYIEQYKTKLKVQEKQESEQIQPPNKQSQPDVQNLFNKRVQENLSKLFVSSLKSQVNNVVQTFY